ncbi:MAG: ribonuclease HII [Candidatus Nanopelagicales bacterium]
MTVRPSLRRERELLRGGHATVAGIDEVGRGALAGPVAVGVAVVDSATRTAPQGLRDSKLLTPAQRTSLAPRVRRWARHTAVGMAGPDEVDRWGLTAALRLAALRALEQVPPVSVIILDGSHDWLTEPPPTLFDPVPWPDVEVPQVVRVIKGDRICSSVAAASVVAKVTRDSLMVDLAEHHPGYGWDVNKGYSTADHSAAIRSVGLCEHHRRSWRVAAAEETLDLREPTPAQLGPATA